MRTCVIINPKAGSAEQVSVLEDALERQDAISCWQTAEAGDARALAIKALEDGFDRIVAAGGDGTISEVVNGMMPGERAATLGIIPLGTGNDLARTLALPNDPRDALALVLADGHRPIDVIKATSGDRTVYGINAAAGGFTGQVNEIMTSEMKATWGPLAYLFGAASALPDLRDYHTRIALDDEPEEAIDAFNVVIANGRSIGGGKRVAPHANPMDGLLDVVIVKQAGALELAGLAAKFAVGDHLKSPHVIYRCVKHIRVTSKPGMWFNVDGELLAKEPLTFTVLPGALNVVVGSEFQAHPVG